MSKRKYKKGRVLENLEEFMYFLEIDNFIYVRHKIYHKGWALSWTLRYVVYCIRGGYINRAIKIKEE